MAFPHLTEHSRLSSESKMQLAREGVAAAATASKITATALIMLNTVVLHQNSAELSTKLQ